MIEYQSVVQEWFAKHYRCYGNTGWRVREGHGGKQVPSWGKAWGTARANRQAVEGLKVAGTSTDRTISATKLCAFNL